MGLGLGLLEIGRSGGGVAVAAALGFGLSLILFSGIREVLALADAPKSFRGTAIALVTAGILSLSFMGFAGLVK